MSTMKGKDKQAANRLEDLEVREVSVVDKPANQRPFLIIKRAMEASDMPPEVTADLSAIEDAENLIALLALEEEEPAPPEAVTVDLAGLEPIFKLSTAGQAVQSLAPLLQRLLAVVNGMKKIGDGPLPPAIVSQVKGMIGAINLLAGKGKTEEAKVDEGQLKKATQALEKLVALVNRLKEQDAGDELGEKEASELGAIASLLNAIAGSSEEEKKPEDDEKGKKPEADADGDGKDAAQKSDDDDPIIVIKAGAKMRRARLSQFRKAVEVLATLLKELEGEPPIPEKDKDKKKTTKKEGDEELVEKITALTETVTKLTGQLAERDEKIVDLTKRVEGIENIRPTGEDDDPPEPIEKKKSLWTGVV